MAEKQRRALPFELHRIVEYGLAVVLVSVFVNDHARRPVVGAAGAVLLLLAATTRGRLGMVQAVSPRLHRALDVVVVIGLAAAPFVPGAGGLYVAQYLLPCAGVVAWLVSRSRSDRRPAAGARGRVTAPTPLPTDAPPTVPGPPLARKLGRLTGRLLAATRKDPPEQR